MTIWEYFEQFIFQKQLQGLSDFSIRSYRDHIGVFVKYIGESSDLSDITLEKVNAYIFSLYNKKLAKATIATYIRNLRIFLTWINTEYGGLPFEPKKIKIPKTPKKLVRIYTDEEIQYIFSLASVSVPWITARNRAIIALMLDSGIRQSEICSLLKINVSFDTMSMKVTGKGAKDRFVPLGYISSTFLKDYLLQCPYKDVAYVFVNKLGKPLSCNAIKVFANRLKHQLPFEFSSHKLRHNFATNYCIDHIHDSGNTNVYDLSIIMGHESIETTKKYEHFAHEMLALQNRISHLDKVYKA